MKSVNEIIAAMPPEDKKRLEKLAAAEKKTVEEIAAVRKLPRSLAPCAPSANCTDPALSVNWCIWTCCAFVMRLCGRAWREAP